MKADYLSVIALVERLHRRYLDLVSRELTKLGVLDINGIQAMILFNIGDMELTVGELTHRGCYQGSNVSYNVKKLVEDGYLSQERSTHDRRTVRVRLTDKAKALVASLDAMVDAQVKRAADSALTPEGFATNAQFLKRLERFWLAAAQHGRIAA